MRAPKEITKPSKLRDRFRMLIDSLRQKQNFKDKISKSSLQDVTEAFKSDIEKEITDIVPVTQGKNNEMKSDINSESSSLKQYKDLKIINNSSFAFIEDKQIQEAQRQIPQNYQAEHQEQNVGIVVNRVERLNPEVGLQCPSHEGRVGTIRNQTNSINARFRQSQSVEKKKDEYRYIKLALKGAYRQQIVPSQVQKDKVCIKQLNDVELVKFWNTSKKLNEGMSHNQYICYFQDMVAYLSINVNQPIIKKYKNCIYFGQNPLENTQYQGIIYYFDEKLYYGQFVNGVKHGYGIEINFKDSIKYAGNFNGGKKNGFFFVQKNMENYEGILQHGLYHGKGKLLTQEYNYTGSFQDGKKHGYGVQHYPKTGLKLVGFFSNGIYQNLNQMKLKKAAVSQPQLQNKLEKIVTSSRSQLVDFRIELTSKLLKSQKHQSNQDINVSKAEVVSIKEVPFQGQQASSLSDLLSNTSRTNKYNFQTSKLAKRFPKIYIQGIKSTEVSCQNEAKTIINRQSRAEFRQRQLSRRKNVAQQQIPQQQAPMKFSEKASQFFLENDIPVLKKVKKVANW